MSAEMPIVILGPRMTDDSKSVWKVCIELGWSPQRAQGWRVPSYLLSKDRPIVIYGEPLFAEAVADQMGLVLLEPSIDWLTTVPREFLKREIEMTTLGEARLRKSEMFVKPADGKIFDPKVYSSGVTLPTDENVDLDIPVLISGIVDFRLEVRCFVQSREIVALSPYWRNDDLAVDENGFWPFLGSEESEARKFAQSVLDDSRIAFPPACTLDVGRVADDSWAIIEANPCWGAGLYGCNPKDVLLSIGCAILKRTSVIEADKQWISKRRHNIHEHK